MPTTDPKPTYVYPRTQWRERLRELQRAVFCAFDFPRSSAAAVWVSRFVSLVILATTANLVVASFPIGAAARGVPRPGVHAGRAGRQMHQGGVQPRREGGGAVGQRRGRRRADGRLFGAAADDRRGARECGALGGAGNRFGRKLGRCSVVSDAVNFIEPTTRTNQTHTQQTPRLRSGGWKLTWEYACGVYGLVDLLSVLPFFVNLLFFPPALSLRTYNQDVLAAMHFSRSLRLLKPLRCVRAYAPVWIGLGAGATGVGRFDGLDNHHAFSPQPQYRYSKHTILFRRTLEASLPALRFVECPFLLSELTTDRVSWAPNVHQYKSHRHALPGSSWRLVASFCI